jgi:hypothetical protein
MIYKTLHGKLKIVQLESHSKKGRDEYRHSERVTKHMQYSPKSANLKQKHARMCI